MQNFPANQILKKEKLFLKCISTLRS